MKDEQKKILEALLDYAEKSHRSYASIARQLGIAQNTISNWKNGKSISTRNQQKILKMIASSTHCEEFDIMRENTENPIMHALLGVIAGLPERDIAKIYAFALELRDLPTQYGYVNASTMKAAEEPAPFNKN